MSCCYEQSKICGGSTLSGLWLDIADIPASNTIKQSSTCYYFDGTNKSLFCHGTLHSGFSSVTSCSDTTCSTSCGGTVCPPTVTVTVANTFAGFCLGNVNGTFTIIGDALSIPPNQTYSYTNATPDFSINLYCLASSGIGLPACAIGHGYTWIAIISAPACPTEYMFATMTAGNCPPSGVWACICDGSGVFICHDIANRSVGAPGYVAPTLTI